MWPFELVATATDSPSDSPAGSFRKFGTDVNGISATPVIVAFCCAAAETAVRSSATNVQARYLGIGTSSTNDHGGQFIFLDFASQFGFLQSSQSFPTNIFDAALSFLNCHRSQFEATLANSPPPG